MKLLVTLDFPPEKGGIQRHLHAIVSRTFHAQDLVLVGCTKGRPKAALSSGAPVEYVPVPVPGLGKKWSLLPLTMRIVALRRKTGASLDIECGNVYAALAPRLASLFGALKYGVYVHGSEIANLDKAGLKQRLLRSALEHADRIIANSGFTASIASSLCVKARVSVVCPKISLPAGPAPKHRVAQTRVGERGTVRMLSVGRLVAHKGHAVLLSAASLLPQDFDWKLVIAGDGPLWKVLEQSALQLKIADRVEFKRSLSDEELSKEYDAASLFVFPSTLQGGVEGFGIALLEAMAAHVPIVATDSGGIPEVLDGGACGLLVPPGDSAALANAIINLARDAARRTELASAAWERLVRHYVW